LLARADVGLLRIIDRDYVETSNLQRQSLFEEKDAAESLPKAIAASRKIACFNSEIVVEPRVEDLTPANINVLLQGMDVILDGSDNYETRYLVNDYAVKNAVQWICGGSGQLRGDIERVAGNNGLPGMHFSGYAAGNG
jgi:molybdopterin-synthase adenylyltransferase